MCGSKSVSLIDIRTCELASMLVICSLWKATESSNHLQWSITSEIGAIRSVSSEMLIVLALRTGSITA